MAATWKTTATANQNYPGDQGFPIHSGSFEFRAIGATWGGATAKVQISDDRITWADEPSGNLSFTSDNRYGFSSGDGFARINVSGGSGHIIPLYIARVDGKFKM